jgi:hypothetical protein
VPRREIDCGSKICRVCGRTFTRKRFASGLEDRTRFLQREHCSQACANSRDVVSRLQHNARARKLLGCSCEVCGGTHRLAVHHIDEDWTNGAPDNIQTLCSPCHSRHHMRARLEMRLRQVAALQGRAG